MNNRLIEQPDDEPATFLEDAMIGELLRIAMVRLRGCPIGQAYMDLATEFMEANPSAWFAPSPIAVDAVIAAVATIGVDTGPDQVIRMARVMTLASGYAATAEANKMRMAAGSN